MKLVNSRDDNLQQDSNDNEEDGIETSPDQGQNDDQDRVNSLMNMKHFLI